MTGPTRYTPLTRRHLAGYMLLGVGAGWCLGGVAYHLAEPLWLIGVITLTCWLAVAALLRWLL